MSGMENPQVYVYNVLCIGTCLQNAITHAIFLYHSKVLKLTLKSIPTVEMKLPERKAPSLNRTRRHVLPTPLSPMSITCRIIANQNAAFMCKINFKIHKFKGMVKTKVNVTKSS